MLGRPPLDYSPLNYAPTDCSPMDCSAIDRSLTDVSLTDAAFTDGAFTEAAFTDGALIDRSLRPAEDQEVVRELAYVLRSWPGVRGRRRGDDALARITAERLVDYLHLSGFELMKRPMVTDTSYIGGGR